ncbi:hypothetical protein FRC12_009210, partial [Ceratobasidium sp. 428]
MAIVCGLCGPPRLDTAIFICQLSYPSMPSLLHFFESRYRLMLHRCLAPATPCFGTILPQQSEKNTEDNDCGTMLQIKSVQMLSDGRSMVETFGTFRFRILERGTLDGYLVGRIARTDDYPPKIEWSVPTGTSPMFAGSLSTNYAMIQPLGLFSIGTIPTDRCQATSQVSFHSIQIAGDIQTTDAADVDQPEQTSERRKATGYQRKLEDQFLKRLCLDGEEVEPGYAPSDLGQDDEDDADAEYEYEDEHEHKLQYPPYQHQHQGYYASVHPATHVQPSIPSQAHECAMPMPV